MDSVLYFHQLNFLLAGFFQSIHNSGLLDSTTETDVADILGIKDMMIFFKKGCLACFYSSQPNGGLFGTAHPLMIITFIIYEQTFIFQRAKNVPPKEVFLFSFGSMYTARDPGLIFLLYFFFLFIFFSFCISPEIQRGFLC